MTKKLRLIASALLMLSPCALAAEWPPKSASSELGLSSSTERGVEIRVWLGGGPAQPFDLYRIIEIDGTVSVPSIGLMPKAPQPLLTSRESAREAARLRKFLAKNYCPGGPNETANYLWCAQTLKRKGHWSILLNDLLPGE